MFRNARKPRREKKEEFLVEKKTPHSFPEQKNRYSHLDKKKEREKNSS